MRSLRVLSDQDTIDFLVEFQRCCHHGKCTILNKTVRNIAINKTLKNVSRCNLSMKIVKRTKNANTFVNEVNDMEGPIAMRTEHRRITRLDSFELNHLCIIRNASSTPTLSTKNGIRNLKNETHSDTRLPSPLLNLLEVQLISDLSLSSNFSLRQFYSYLMKLSSGNN